MVQGVISPDSEEVQPIGAPRNNDWGAGRYTAQGFPIRLPRRSVPSLMVHGMIESDTKNVKSVGAPRCNGRGTGEDAAQGIPVSLPPSFPGAVPNRIFRTQGENVDAVRGLGHHSRATVKNAPKVFPVP